MFCATELRNRAKKTSRLDAYTKRPGFVAIASGLLSDGVPENDIMRTKTGPGGGTYLHDAFFMDFMQWIGGRPYYLATKQFMIYPTRKDQT